MQDVFPTTLYNYFLFSFTKYDTYSRICTRSKKQGYTSLAITDKDVLYGAPEFYRICVEEGVQPIIGLHLSYTYEEKNYGLLAYAKDEIGYQQLMKLSSRKMIQENWNLQK